MQTSWKGKWIITISCAISVQKTLQKESTLHFILTPATHTEQPGRNCISSGVYMESRVVKVAVNLKQYACPELISFKTLQVLNATDTECNEAQNVKVTGCKEIPPAMDRTGLPSGTKAVPTIGSCPPDVACAAEALRSLRLDYHDETERR